MTELIPTQGLESTVNNIKTDKLAEKNPRALALMVYNNQLPKHYALQIESDISFRIFYVELMRLRFKDNKQFAMGSGISYVQSNGSNNWIVDPEELFKLYGTSYDLNSFREALNKMKKDNYFVKNNCLEDLAFYDRVDKTAEIKID